MPAIALLGVAGVGVVLGGIFGGMALSAKSSFNAHPRGNTSDADKEQLDARVADAAFGVAIAAGVTGIVLLIVNRPAPVAAGAASPMGPGPS